MFRRTAEVLEYIDPLVRIPDRRVVIVSEGFGPIEARGRMRSELGARLVSIGEGRTAVVIADPEEINRIWNLTAPDAPFKFVERENVEVDYLRGLANRQITISNHPSYQDNVSHDYSFHVVGYKILAERGLFTPYADALKECFTISDSKLAGPELIKLANEFRFKFGSGFEHATIHLSMQDRRSSLVTSSLVKEQLKFLEKTLKEFSKFKETSGVEEILRNQPTR